MPTRLTCRPRVGARSLDLRDPALTTFVTEFGGERAPRGGVLAACAVSVNDRVRLDERARDIHGYEAAALRGRKDDPAVAAQVAQRKVDIDVEDEVDKRRPHSRHAALGCR